uniref:RNA-directed DNA polymerase, eukaryota, reverse transcriptase zinc-binding domain protein n=1 Tax=Tanacetum cinerariifolium TaxID=118510 RepID=A0A699HUC4_TANCI|nr:RNA-directed DNA polymerase, eukaryota, reverse transcriptase zinc-binding domain protein [Tanacetum cinerariifolium]
MNLRSSREEEEVISENVGEEVLNDEGIYKEKCVNVDSNGNDFEPDLNAEDNEGVFGTYVHKVYSSTEFDCNVHKSPLHNDEGIEGNNVSQISETGIEVVIFDEEIVQKGSEIWGLTICGQFVGYDMHISELRYNIRRMWGKFGIAEIDKWKNSFEIRMNKVEPKKLPVWVKIVNVPLEAWYVKRISAMASSLGKHIFMDSMTTAMCHKGTGNISYARVLVEMDLEKELKNEIKIQYVDKCKNVKGNKKFKLLMIENHLSVPIAKYLDMSYEIYSQKQSNRFGRMDMPENSRKEYRKKQAGADANVKKDKDQELIMLKERMIVDKYLNEKVQPTLYESFLWSKDMIKYFKERWERDIIKENTPTYMEDVLEANDERRDLWEEFIRDCRYVDGKPLCIASDINVTLYLNEHSSGSSVMTHEFLRKSYPVQEVEDYENLFQRKISNEVSLNMIADVSDYEIKKAMFDIEDFKAPVKEFFSSRRMLREINATLISLIPKVDTLNKVTDFRPIACCNVIYKCISKVITNKIKPILGMLVSNNQCAFIPERSIQDNILLTQEIMKGYNRKWGPKRVAIKIDLQKAYDTVSLSFLKSILKNFGFHDKMVDWIMVIKSALYEFSACSGLLPNNSKSTVFFGSLDEEEKREILNVIPFTTSKLPVRYLEVPLITKRLSVKDCVYLMDKIKSKIRNWKNKCESVKGKAKVAWKDVCRPKDQSEIGLKNLYIWNQALLSKHVWNIATKNDTLWVKWVHSVKLRGKSIWVISAEINDCWGWKNLLSKRDLIRNNVRHIIGNGNKTSMWFDNWTSEVLKTNLKSGATVQLIDVFYATMTEKTLIIYFLSALLLKNYGTSNIMSIIRRLAFVASIYNIWQERNRRIFKESKRSCDEVFKNMVEMIKNNLIGITVKDSLAVRDIERRWAITCKKIHFGKCPMNDSPSSLSLDPINEDVAIVWC